MKILPALLLPLFLISCTSTRNSIGFPLKEDLSEKLTGEWGNPEGSFKLHCDAEGNLNVAVAEWKGDTGRFELDVTKGPLKRLNDEFYIANLKEAPEDEGYGFVILKFEDDSVICWGPNGDAFQNLVKADELKGESGKYAATLFGDGLEIAKKLVEKDLRDLVKWDEPKIFWKSQHE